MRKIISVLPVLALLFTACGLLEGEPFIFPITEDRITRFMNDRAVINLLHHENADQPAFSHFAIFYRIYISDTYVAATTTDTFAHINTTLNADFNHVAPFIDSDTLIGTNMHILFTGRNFRYLELEQRYPVAQQVETNQILREMLGHQEVEFSFEHSPPTLSFDGRTFTLLRATGHPGLPSFQPHPDRRFVNTIDLRNPEYIDANRNADVADRAGAVGPQYREITYAALFVAGVGMNPTTFGTVFSTPALIHVFRLPDEF